MEQIQTLVAPLLTDEALKRLRKIGSKIVREYRRPQRTVNGDSCDSCRKGGKLLSCNRCLASFHLQCHDPPLKEDDIPKGEWICHGCRVCPEKDKDKDEALSVSSSTSPQHSICHASSNPRSPSNDIMMMETSPTEEIEPDKEDASPLATLIRAASLMNPTYFELSKDFKGCTIPGSTKHQNGTGSNKRRCAFKELKQSAKKQAHELDNGIVPLPARVCFTCSRNCRVAPLIHCDYCPLLFHLDCLDPPLVTPPQGRWMCPNHTENRLDEKLLTPVGLTERVKIVDEFNGNINQQAVNVGFLKKTHQRHHKRKTLKVPQAVKDKYRLLSPVVPRINEPAPSVAFNSQACSKRPPEASLDEQAEWLTSVVAMQTSISKYLAHCQLRRDGVLEEDSGKSLKTVFVKPVASVHPVIKQKQTDTPATPTSITSHTLNNSPHSASTSELSDKDDQTLPNGLLNSSDINQDTLVKDNKVNGPVSFLNHTISIPNGDIDEFKSEGCDTTSGKTVKSAEPLCSSSNCSTAQDVVRFTAPRSSSGSHGTSNSKPKNLVISDINKGTIVSSKILTNCNTTAKVSNHNQTSVLSSQAQVGVGAVKVSGAERGKTSVVLGTLLNSINSRVMSVSSAGQGKSSPLVNTGGSVQTRTITPATLSASPAIINLNATLQACISGTGDCDLSKLDERLVQILAWQRLQQLLPATYSNTPSKKGMVNGMHSVPGSHQVRARALMCPLSGKGQPTPMPYRTLSIGTGADMDVCLTSHGHCDFVSAKHACIFYDDISKHHELLNYSEHGTTVDNVLYSCDFSEKSSSWPPPTCVVASVRNLINEARGKRDLNTTEKTCAMTSKALEDRVTCNCKASSSSLIGGSGAGWEGTAILHHGSYIKVGCLQFVFSIVDQAPAGVNVDQKRAPPSILKPQQWSSSLS